MFLGCEGLSCAANSAVGTIATTIRISRNYREMGLDASAQQGSALPLWNHVLSLQPQIKIPKELKKTLHPITF